MSYRQLLEQVQTQVQALFNTDSKPELFYHNLSHTEHVVAAATQIGNYYQLNDRDFFVVIVAAWFHDVGYLEGQANHEEKGAQKADVFLTSLGVTREDIDAIKNCIMATKMPQAPHNLLEEIICDADLFHLSTDGFIEKSKLIRKEARELYGKNFSKEEWRAKTISLFQHHQYHTAYGRTQLEPKKQKNMAALISKQNKEAIVESNTDDLLKPSIPTINTEAGKKKSDRPERGIETMFRISSNNHQRLSDMADNKSQIIITVNSIIISAVVSLLLRKLDSNDYLTIPAIMLLVVSLIAIVLSILSARPSIPNGTFSQTDLDKKKVNLLFFGNFYNMSLESYTEGMLKVMDDRDFLYRTLIKDLYSQGVVLGRKYKLLRASYNVFMFGLIASVVGFIIASLLAGSFLK